MVVRIGAMRSALHLLYYDRADIYTPVQTHTDDELSDVRFLSEPTYRDVAGQMSYPQYTDERTDNGLGRPAIGLDAIYICDPEISVPTGSQITIRRGRSTDGDVYHVVTGRVATAGTSTNRPSVGENHQEIPFTVTAVQ